MATGFPDEVIARLAEGETIAGDELALGGAGFDSGALGIVWDRMSRDELHAHVEPGPAHHQPYGIVHGGVWCGIIETMASFGAALRAAVDGKLAVGVSNTTDFLRSHREGRIDGVATPIHVGRQQHLWQVVLTRAADGKAVARGQVRLQIVDPAQIGG